MSLFLSAYLIFFAKSANFVILICALFEQNLAQTHLLDCTTWSFSESDQHKLHSE